MMRQLLTLLVACCLTASIVGCSDDESATGPTPEADATYRVTFESTWSAASHPTDFPGNPHVSQLVGGTHCGCASFWTPGELATPGIKSMAEQGGVGTLSSEVQAAIDMNLAEFTLVGGGIATSPGTTSLEFSVSLGFSRVTLVSMVAPSPDWFVGVSGLNLIENGDWIDSVKIDLYPYDAGTDDGTTYTSPNSATSPPVPVFAITDGPLSVGGSVPSVGSFTFVRVQAIR